MQAIRRVAVTLLALLAIAAGGAGGVRAADPSLAPTVGGTLSAAGHTITVYSNGNVPAHVFMSAESVTLSLTEFDIAPGTTRELTFTGKATGTVSALFSVVPVEGQEGGSALLRLGLSPAVPPPFDPPWALVERVFIGLAFLLLLALLARRLRPWEWRIVRSQSGQGIAEYALVVSLIAIVGIVGLLLIGERLQEFITGISDNIGNVVR